MHEAILFDADARIRFGQLVKQIFMIHWAVYVTEICKNKDD